MTGVNDIRSSFLDYFGANDHQIVPSASLVPSNDPTLLFTNAGMVPFKNVFTGQEKRPYSRATTSQKCVRAGGKHNDLDNVGYTARHHTFFEMLGNFSFGDYFKPDAIELAWRLVTRDLGLDASKLLVTVYHTDDEAAELWKKVAGLSDERIIRIATSDNFWAMGDTGPCGPCSEIFYDHGEGIPGGPPGSPDEDGDRFIEIWNLVFMQYERVLQPDGTIEQRDLPRPSIDTGMGLERIAAVMQGVHDNYDIDLFRRLIEASEAATGTRADGEREASHRVIADHLRASAFLIADGVLPSNEGRGYVLRRIMRRAMRHAQLLGAAEPLLHRLVPALTTEMGGAYPELVQRQSLIGQTLELEETRFRRTLDRGLTLLDEASEGLGEGQSLDGETAFKLYDTYGFPLDLTEDALRRRDIGVDREGFEAAMARQKAEARAAWRGSGDAAAETVWLDIADEAGPTEFLGYELNEADAVVVAIVDREGNRVENAGEGDDEATFRVVLNQTPFYAESGGQQGDRGALRAEGAAEGVSLDVVDTTKTAGLHIHHVRPMRGTVAVGDTVRAEIHDGRRAQLRVHHSATHLVHEALREVLGDHVTQKGSLVAPDRLRFDFSHASAMSDEEIARVEELANVVTAQNAPVSTRLMAVDDAIALGARAQFGEKYGETVRVVSMGEQAGEPYSVELCGGTHVASTGDVGTIRLVSESGVSSGVRRLEALAGRAARFHLTRRDAELGRVAALLKTVPDEAAARVAALLDERRKLTQELAEARRAAALGGGAGGEAEPETVHGTSFIGRVLDGVPPKELKGMADEAKNRMGSGIAALIAVNEGKASAVVAVTDDLTGTHSAVDLVRLASAALRGKGGGGRPDMAQAGGPDGSKASDALDAVRAALAGARAEAAE